MLKYLIAISCFYGVSNLDTENGQYLLPKVESNVLRLLI